jgi:hypothetical protein
MKVMSFILVLFFPLLMVSCTSSSGTSAHKPGADEEKIKANLAKLSDEDRKVAEEQKFCAIEPENRLGSMGVPQKMVVDKEPVFLCCKSCMKDAQEHPEKAAAKAKELRAHNGTKQ